MHLQSVVCAIDIFYFEPNVGCLSRIDHCNAALFRLAAFCCSSSDAAPMLVDIRL